MGKAYKAFCVFLCLVLVIASFFMVFTIKPSIARNAFDLYDCNIVIDDIKNFEMNMTSVIYVKNDKDEWEEYQRLHGEENRIWVDLEYVPKDLINAYVAIEDKRFFDHDGVDWKRTISAFANLYLHFWSSEQGGSTITQQLIKNITKDNDKSNARKIREIVRALAVEKALDKETILEAYLNTISLGSGICGVQVAANYYFNKDIGQLNLVECAALAGITKNPSLYNPSTHPEENLKRRRAVLDAMREEGFISVDEYNDAYEQELKLDLTQKVNNEEGINSYYVDALISNVSENLANSLNISVEDATQKLYNGGYKIYSCVDLDIQSAMEKVYTNVSGYFSQKDKSGKHVQSAMTIMDYSGHVVGVIGGVGEKTVNRALNRALDSPRQPGSTMKPMGAYAPGIDAGVISYYSNIADKPIKDYFEKGKPGPKEWYGYYMGTISVRLALEHSANTIPCWIVKDYLGIDQSYDFVTQKLHLNHLTEADKNLSALALGGSTYGVTTTESAAAYAIFGNRGKYYSPVTYYKVEDAHGNVILSDQSEGEQVITPGTAAQMNKMLQNVVYGSQGTGHGISGYSKMRAYAKTGTSSESNDLWMVAGTPYYVGSVWYGFDTPRPIYNAGAAASVWRAVMTQVHKELEVKDLDILEDFEKKTYCTNTGLLASKKCSSVKTGDFPVGVDVKTCSGKHEYVASDRSKESSAESSNQSSSQAPESSQATESSSGASQQQSQAQ